MTVTEAAALRLEILVTTAEWARAENQAAKDGVDCADMTLSEDDMKTLMDAAIDEVLASAESREATFLEFSIK